MTKEEYEEELNHIQKARFSKEDKERLIRELESAYYTETVKRKREELNKILSRAIIGTIDNHPLGFGLGKGMIIAISKLYHERLSNIELAEFFCKCISAKSVRFNVSLREEVLKYYKEHPDSNIILDIISLLEDYTSEKEKLRSIQDLIYAINRNNIYWKLNNDSFAIPYAINLGEFFNNNNVNHNYFKSVFLQFKDNIDTEKLFAVSPKEDEDIEIEEITGTCYSALSNSDGFRLIDSFSGKLLDGNIEIASDRGYRSRPERPQQDAVGSLVYDENHYINIVADGVGGTEKGHMASLEFVKEALDWYRRLYPEARDDIEKSLFFLNNMIKIVNKKIINKYGNEAQTTYVIALTVGDKTIISNVGDSTAYTYDEETDTLIELTTLDSPSFGLSYDEARNNPNNNVVTEVIGASDEVYPHTNIIDNTGQTIILSSDGITDLASEETFKGYFRNNTSASEMVDKAVYEPDQNPYKMQDNVSAIKIILPNGNIRRKGL